MDQVVTLARRASAFHTIAGIFYCLFETTYRKNAVHPKQETRCVAFGTYEDAMRWIFTAMASCGSGMLQGVNGSIDPADYLRHWRHALRRPDEQFTQPIWIEASSAADATLPISSPFAYHANRLGFAVETLAANGYPVVAKMVAAGTPVVMDLHRDAAVLAKIYGSSPRSRIEPARIIQPHGTGEGNPALAPRSRPGKRRAPTVHVFHLDDPGRLVVMTQGFPSIMGSRDEVVFEFLREIAAELEITQDGGGLEAFAALNGALAVAIEPAPGHVRVTIDKASLQDMMLFRGNLDHIERGLRRNARHREGAVSASVRSLREAGSLHYLAALPSFSLAFRAPARRRAPMPA